MLFPFARFSLSLTATFTITVSNKSKLLVLCLSIVVLGQFAAAMVEYVEEFRTKSFTGQTTSLPSIEALFATTVFSDTVIAITLVVLLLRRKSESPFSKTSTMIHRIMAFCIGTGLITGAFGLIGLVLSITLPSNLGYMGIGEIMPKLYLNCMLTSYVILFTFEAISNRIESTLQVEHEGRYERNYLREKRAGDEPPVIAIE